MEPASFYLDPHPLEEDVPLYLARCADGPNFFLKKVFIEEKDIVENQIVKWRMKDRMKTVSVALIVCLNVGVDPPDVIRVAPCANLECWIDPTTQPAQKALESIGKALLAQYERWQPRARYKQALDPTSEDVKKLCLGLRRTAKDERVLFHYNGHGVPAPTNNGEIWVFNKNYTQYIPLSIYELQSWLGSPSVYVFDCSNAGLVLKWFLHFAQQREKEAARVRAPPSPLLRDCILLAACGRNERLPTNSELPADIFTACLTTPIRAALRWFVYQKSARLGAKVDYEVVDTLPGNLNNRRTPLGELNWIFTSITDTIAWTVLPKDLFQRLFRQDLLVASLFRNFLLAERIMRASHCTPMSVPALPPTFQHSLWQAWDYVADTVVMQLPRLSDPSYTYLHSSFFAEQLTAFELWLNFGSESMRPPEQLPIVLQVLLSQTHRLRALVLLGRFLDLGPWAVNQALSVGIFPYVLKLLQSQSVELRPILVFIWAKILALDTSCQADLVKDNGHNYFIHVLSSNALPSDQRALAAFCLSAITRQHRPGQSACLRANLLGLCLSNLGHADGLLRRWVVLCLATLWEGYDEAKVSAISELGHERLCGLLSDPLPEVRAATVYALSMFFGGHHNEEGRRNIDLNLAITIPVTSLDGSALVRTELVFALARLLETYEAEFKPHVEEYIAAQAAAKPEKKAKKKKKGQRESPSLDISQKENQEGTVFVYLWKVLLSLCADPFRPVAEAALRVRHRVCGDRLQPTLAPPKARFGRSRKGEESQSVLETVDKAATSLFLAWSTQQIFQPLMVNGPDDDPTTPAQVERARRVVRNSAALEEAQQSWAQGGLEDQIAILDNESAMGTAIMFHPFEPLLVVASEPATVSVWNWEEGVRLNAFSLEEGVRLTSMVLLNETNRELVAMGLGSGIVQIWEDVRSPGASVVSAWRGLLDVRTSNPGLLLAWQRRRGCLLASGDSAMLRLWDVQREWVVVDIPSEHDYAITSLCAALDENTVLAGAADGSVKHYDVRIGGRAGLTHSFKEHNRWVVGAHAYRGQLVTGSLQGDVKFWDLRAASSTNTLTAFTDNSMTSFALHPWTGTLACGSQTQKIKVMSNNGTELGMIRYHDGFLGQRIGPVSCLAFHPYRNLLAAGATDSIVSIYSGHTPA